MMSTKIALPTTVAYYTVAYHPATFLIYIKLLRASLNRQSSIFPFSDLL
jgi:hypothetical protein